MTLLRLCAVFASTLFVAGCMSTPAADVAGLPGARKLDIFYITNRAPAPREDGASSYGSERSHSLAYGGVAVTGVDAENSVVAPPSEIGRFPTTPYALDRVPGGVKREHKTVLAHERSLAEIKQAFERRVAQTGRKEVVVFVHGYNNTFDDAAKSAAQICSDLGPEHFTCVALTWPAGGSGGILFGYNVDRESGEFAVTDIRKAIRAIADTPGVRELHFISHSRGTDVLTSALQHLAIEAYVSKGSLSSRFKIANVVLAAPDIDIDVAYSRLMGVPSDPDMLHGNAPERSAVFSPGKLHFTVYSSPGDRALGLSKFLFGSQLRLGLLDALDDPKESVSAPHVGGIGDFIQSQGGGGLIGHSYFLSDPAVRADLVSLIRDRKSAGDPGRALVEVHRPFWYLPDRTQAAK